MRQVPGFGIFSVVMSAELGNNMLAPLLAFIFFSADSPLFSTSPDIAERSLLFGLCLGLYKFGGVAANIVITSFSDHFGRKMALYCSHLGLLIAALFGALSLYIHSPALLIAGFFLVSLLDTVKAIGPAAAGDISQPHNRIHNMAAVQCVISLGACLGPILGGQLANHSFFLSTAYALPFLAAALIAAVSLCAIPFCRETLTAGTHSSPVSLKKIIRDYYSLLQSPFIRRLFFLFILCQISWSTYYEFIPAALKNSFHFSPSQAGWFVGLIAFWLLLASSLVIRFLLRYFERQRLLWISTAALAAGILLTVWATQHPHQHFSLFLLWFAAAPTAMGDVIFFSLFIALLSKNAMPAHQGKMMGLMMIIAMLVWTATAFAGGYLLTLHPNGPLLFSPIGAIALLCALGIYFPLFDSMAQEETTL